MSLLKVARMGHPVLRARAREVERAELKQASMQKLIDDMIDTMHEYHGVGLAAPQIHEGCASSSPPSRRRTRSRCRLTTSRWCSSIRSSRPSVTEIVEDWEGCLSIPDIRGRVPRARAIRVTAMDRAGGTDRDRVARFPGARHPARDRSPGRRAVFRSHAHVRLAVVSGRVRAVLGQGQGLRRIDWKIGRLADWQIGR